MNRKGRTIGKKILRFVNKGILSIWKSCSNQIPTFKGIFKFYFLEKVIKGNYKWTGWNKTSMRIDWKVLKVLWMRYKT
jgi:hypothetical protein